VGGEEKSNHEGICICSSAYRTDHVVVVRAFCRADNGLLPTFIGACWDWIMDRGIWGLTARAKVMIVRISSFWRKRTWFETLILLVQCGFSSLVRKGSELVDLVPPVPNWTCIVALMVEKNSGRGRIGHAT
jgi:hypothetical protein